MKSDRSTAASPSRHRDRAPVEVAQAPQRTRRDNRRRPTSGPCPPAPRAPRPSPGTTRASASVAELQVGPAEREPREAVERIELRRSAETGRRASSSRAGLRQPDAAEVGRVDAGRVELHGAPLLFGGFLGPTRPRERVSEPDPGLGQRPRRRRSRGARSSRRSRARAGRSDTETACSARPTSPASAGAYAASAADGFFEERLRLVERCPSRGGGRSAARARNARRRRCAAPGGRRARAPGRSRSAAAAESRSCIENISSTSPSTFSDATVSPVMPSDSCDVTRRRCPARW